MLALLDMSHQTRTKSEPLYIKEMHKQCSMVFYENPYNNTDLVVSMADEDVKTFSSASVRRVRNSFSLSSAARASLVYPSSICKSCIY